VKRDIKSLPDTWARLWAACAGFMGLGAPFLLQGAVDAQAHRDCVLAVAIGAVLMLGGLVFGVFAWKDKGAKDRLVDNIMENIKDYSQGAPRPRASR
jgi:hypothetical protein